MIHQDISSDISVHQSSPIFRVNRDTCVCGGGCKKPTGSHLAVAKGRCYDKQLISTTCIALAFNNGLANH